MNAPPLSLFVGDGEVGVQGCGDRAEVEVEFDVSGGPSYPASDVAGLCFRCVVEAGEPADDLCASEADAHELADVGDPHGLGLGGVGHDYSPAWGARCPGAMRER